MSVQRFTIPGVPVPFARPRFNGKTKAVYNSAPQMVYREKLRVVFMGATMTLKPEPVFMSVRIFCPALKSSKKGTPETLKTTRPDLDNYFKPIGDAGEGILYEDDAQIAGWLDSRKFYAAQGDEPRVEVVVYG